MKTKKLPTGIEPPPIELSDMAMTVWIETWKAKPEGVKWIESDYYLLATYCREYAVWMDCSDYIESNGYAKATKTGYRSQHPEVSIGNKALANCERLAKLLGITPLSRKNLGIESKPIKKETKMKALMKKSV